MALYPVYSRGEAYLSAHQGREATAEFQKILGHRGVVINEPIGALAHLQLGRAYATMGDTAKARAAYQDFLTLWKDADSDIPILIAAKAEYTKLKWFRCLGCDARRVCTEEPPVQKSVLLKALQQEILRHDFSYFVDEPPSIAQGGKGVVVPGCPTLHETHQYDESVLRPSGGRCDACVNRKAVYRSECEIIVKPEASLQFACTKQK